MLEMTAEQKYAEVLKELGALIADKNTTISCQRWQIEQLKEKLAAAEHERDEFSRRWNATAAQLEEVMDGLEGGAA